MRHSGDNKIGIHGLGGPAQQEKGQVTVTVTVTFAYAALFRHIVRLRTPRHVTRVSELPHVSGGLAAALREGKRARCASRQLHQIRSWLASEVRSTACFRLHSLQRIAH